MPLRFLPALAFSIGIILKYIVESFFKKESTFEHSLDKKAVVMIIDRMHKHGYKWIVVEVEQLLLHGFGLLCLPANIKVGIQVSGDTVDDVIGI